MGFFDFLTNLFRRQGEPHHSTASPSASFHIAIQEGAPPQPGLLKQSRFSEGSPLQELQAQIQGKGRPEYPFLSREYSPSSRVPCVDFTPFVIERLRAGDVRSIGQLMRRIIEANPGLGFGSGWIETEVEQVLRAPLERYLHLPDPDAYHQLRAMWIIASKGGGGRQYWLTDELPRYFAQAISPFEMELPSAIEELRKRANRFIREMRKDASYWLDFPPFKASELIIPPLPAGECVARVRRLSIGARLHLFRIVEVGGGRLPQLTGFILRDLGLYAPDSTREIMESGLVISSQAPGLLKNSFEKTELLTACDQAGVICRKTWNKEKQIQALLSAPAYVGQFIADAMLASVNPKYGDCLQALLARAQQVEPVFKVLCFI